LNTALDTNLPTDCVNILTSLVDENESNKARVLCYADLYQQRYDVYIPYN